MSETIVEILSILMIAKVVLVLPCGKCGECWSRASGQGLETVAEVARQAVAAGWSVSYSGKARCPTCRADRDSIERNPGRDTEGGK